MAAIGPGRGAWLGMTKGLLPLAIGPVSSALRLYNRPALSLIRHYTDSSNSYYDLLYLI